MQIERLSVVPPLPAGPELTRARVGSLHSLRFARESARAPHRRFRLRRRSAGTRIWPNLRLAFRAGAAAHERGLAPQAKLISESLRQPASGSAKPSPTDVTEFTSVTAPALLHGAAA